MQLVCTPPEFQPPGNDDRGLPMVTVKVGQFLRFQVGYLQYELMKTNNFPVEAYFVAAIAAFILLSLFAFIVFVYRRKVSVYKTLDYKFAFHGRPPTFLPILKTMHHRSYFTIL